MTVQIFYTGNLVISDGSDIDVHGDGCEPGHGQTLESGWVDPDWTLWEVYENYSDVRPDTFTSDDGPLIEWVADQLTERLGWPEDMECARPTVYASNAIETAYGDKSMRLAAHVDGLSDNLWRAVVMEIKRRIREQRGY